MYLIQTNDLYGPKSKALTLDDAIAMANNMARQQGKAVLIGKLVGTVTPGEIPVKFTPAGEDEQA